MATMPVKKGFFVTSPFGQRRSGMHYGTDFGLEGGSGGQPIYAIRAGQVTELATQGRQIGVEEQVMVEAVTKHPEPEPAPE